MQTQNPAAIPGASDPLFIVAITRAAQDARLYRIAARDCRKQGMPAQARRMERNARNAERAILAAADSIIRYAEVTAVPAHFQRPTRTA